MLTRIIFKLLFKACVPLVAIVGIMSYMLYMQGGDPMAVASKIMGNSLKSAQTSMQRTTNSVKSLTPGTVTTTQVYKWTDANGVTQFGSNPPDGVAATSMTYKNRVPEPRTRQTSYQPTAASGASSRDVGLEGEQLPGVAGMGLPTAVDPAALSEMLKNMQSQ